MIPTKSTQSPDDTAARQASAEADVADALSGNTGALERVLRSAQPLVFGLAVRMLGQREDALDATQDILIRLATHLSEFRGDSRFSTWVYRIAANALLDRLRADARRRERSFTEIGVDLAGALEGASAAVAPTDVVTPEHQIAAAELALVCSQGMLLALAGPARLAYILGEVMQLDAEQGAAVAGVSPVAFRQQLSRARRALREFVAVHCGLVTATAACRCSKQLQALPERKIEWLRRRPLSQGDPMPLLRDAVARQAMDDVRTLRDAASLMRAHANYSGDSALAEALRQRIAATVFGTPH